LADIVENNRSISTFSPSEKNMWEKLDGACAHSEGDIIVVDIAVFTPQVKQQMGDILKAHPKYEQLQKLFAALFGNAKEIMKKYSTPAIHDQLSYYTSTSMLSTRGMAINDLVEAGGLTVPQDTAKSTIGMYLVLNT